MTGQRPREIGRLRLPRISRDWGHGGGPRTAVRKSANLLVTVLGDEVRLGVGYEEVVLGAEEREKFAAFYVQASHEADTAQGGGVA